MQEKIDKLNRGEYIEFIKNLIINSEQHKRNNDNKAYVIALDSPWGTGKSYFIDLFLQNIKNDESICTVKYNAWENDYRNNAFEPLIYDILESNCLQFSIENEAEKENLKKFFSNIGNIGITMGKRYIEKTISNKFGVKIDIPDDIKSTEDIKNFMLRKIPNLAELNLERESFDKFKEYLSKAMSYIKDNNKKLVIIVDELDRCKPTFAIQTLEIVKHLFDIENVVFLFAVDIRQLSFSISSVYGQGFDSVGYLCRFFDYIAKMPVPDINNYIVESLDKINIFDDRSIVSPVTNQNASLKKLISDFMMEIYREFDFSLRDLDTVLQSLKIMLSHFLLDYDSAGAYYIYIFYLSLKYKKPDMFNKIFLEKSFAKQSNQNDFFTFVSDSFRKNIWIKSTVDTIKSNKTLAETEYNLKDIDGSSYGSNRIKVEYAKDSCVGYKRIVDGFFAQLTEISNNNFDSLNNILFWPDLEKWVSIKNLTFKEYLHKQLEMYGFPALEEEKI